MWWRRGVIGFGVVSVLAFVALNVLAYNHAWSLTHYVGEGGATQLTRITSLSSRMGILVHGIKLSRPATRRAAKDLRPNCFDTTISAGNGVTLSAWVCDRGATTPLAIIFHGYGGDKSAMVREGDAFLNMGASVLLVDFRGSGASSEAYTTIGVREAEDVAAVVAHARATMPHKAIVLFGQSMGAAAILRAVARHGVKPDGVIIESVFDTLLNTVRRRFSVFGMPAFPAAHLMVLWGGAQWGFNGFDHRPMADAAALRCPGLFMHGKDDPLATLADGRRVFDAAGGAKRFVEFPGTSHQAYLAAHPEIWIRAVEQFMKDLSTSGTE